MRGGIPLIHFETLTMVILMNLTTNPGPFIIAGEKQAALGHG